MVEDREVLLGAEVLLDLYPKWTHDVRIVNYLAGQWGGRHAYVTTENDRVNQVEGH